MSSRIPIQRADEVPFLIIGPADQRRIDACIRYAANHPRPAENPSARRDDLDGPNEVSLSCGVVASFTLDALSDGRRARHLSVSVEHPISGMPGLPDRRLMLALSRAFGFVKPLIGTMGTDPFVIHAIEFVVAH